MWIWEKWKEGGNRVKNSIYEILKEEQQQNKKKEKKRKVLVKLLITLQLNKIIGYNEL